MLSTEELLRPRFKVIAKYPDSRHKIGSIIHLGPIHPYSGYSYYFNNEMVVAPEYFDKFPAIFKRLEWWEERAIGDLPEYVKVTEDYREFNEGGIYGVEYFSETTALEHILTKCGEVLPKWFATPATLSEYEAYLKQKTK